MAIFYGKSNVNFTQAGIKWNIKKIDSAEHLPLVGKPGEVYVLTDKNINKLKKVATIFEGDELLDNAINIYYQDLTDSKRINYYWGWYFDFKFNSQTTLLNGKLVPTYVYFWDINTSQWVAIQVSYNFREKINSFNFIGENININTLYPDLYDMSVDIMNTIEEEYTKLPSILETFNSSNFVGENINITMVYPDLYDLTETYSATK